MAQMLYHRGTAAPAHRRLFILALFAFMAYAGGTASAQTQGSPDLVISQVYTRGGEPGATYRNDFVEVFNRSTVTVNLSDYTLQVLANLPASPGFPGGLTPVAVRFVSSNGGVQLAPGKYLLYQFGSSGNNGAALPVSPDSDSSTPVNANLPADRGRIALVQGAPTHPYVQYGCAVGVDAALADFFSYGPDTCAEGGANFPAPTVTTAALRAGDGCNDTDDNVADFASAAPGPRNTSSPARLCGLAAPASTFQFEAATTTIPETERFAEIFVTRTGDTSGPASVQYATSNEGANERNDYTTALGTLSFAPGETRRSFRVLITADERPEADEGLTLMLNYPTNGAGLGAQHISRLTITGNNFSFPTNPIDDTDYFVTQHYADFLSRQPDMSGFFFWTGEINGCGADAQCREVKRINVSAAFFLAIEFQETGFYAYRAYKAAFPDSSSRPRGFPLYRELWRDAQRIGRNVIVGPNTGWEGQLATNKRAYTLEFVQRPEFLIRYPQSLTAEQFVDNLNANAGGPLSQAERDQQVSNLNASNNAQGRAAVLAAVIDDTDFKSAESNRAFVLMEYFGYLRRNPFDSPNTDFSGYDFWLGKLNEFHGDYIQAEMVKAFISSDEYRKRFAQ